MRRSIWHMLVLGVSLAVTGAPGVAHAGETWTMPVADGAIVLQYGASYGGMTHHGVDIGAVAGTTVRAPASGRVAFAGQVPADGGGRCGAVTIALADGSSVSLLPLSEVLTFEGAEVSASDAVGTLAAAGDSSTAGPHLHLGLRRGRAYLDPTGLLPVPVSVDPVIPTATPFSQRGPDAGSACDSPLPSPSAAAASSLCAPASAARAVHGAASHPVPAGSADSAAASVVEEPSTSPVSATQAGVAGRHPVPQSADVPVASGVVVSCGVASSWLGVCLGTTRQVPIAPVVGLAPGVLLIAIGVIGLRRQFAHARVG